MTTPQYYIISLQAFDVDGNHVGVNVAQRIDADHVDGEQIAALVKLCAGLPPAEEKAPITINEHAHGDDHHS
jgi:hypothetical protein